MKTFTQLEDRFGKGRKSFATNGGLSVTEVGVAPSSTHKGVDPWDAGDYSGVRHLEPKASYDDASPGRPGKRTVVSKPSRYGDAARRENGKVGVRMFTQSSTELWCDNNIVPSKNYSNTKGISALTTDQLTKRYLYEIAANNPKVERELTVLRESGLSIPDIEKNEDRILRSQKAEERRRATPATIIPAKVKSYTLGASVVTPPFGTSNTCVDPNQYRHSKRFNISPADHYKSDQCKAEVHHCKRGMYRDPEAGKGVPYDTIVDGVPYPEPPSVGHSVVNNRYMVRPRPDAQNSVGDDADTKVLQKAMNKASHGHSNRDNCQQQFIFGDIPPPEAHRSLLREKHEYTLAKMNSQPVIRGKGRVYASKPTSLW